MAAIVATPDRADPTCGGGIEIEEMGLGNQRLPQRDVMAAGALEPRRVPGVLDLPIARRQRNDTEQRLALRAGDRLAVLGDNAEPADPVGMRATAGEWPAAPDAIAVGHALCRSTRLG